LTTKVEILNNEFSKLNARTDGPKFSFDLLKCSRVRTGRNKRKLKSKYTFNMKDLYNDGIHSNPGVRFNKNTVFFSSFYVDFNPLLLIHVY
jgi:hypothetical protein